MGRMPATLTRPPPPPLALVARVLRSPAAPANPSGGVHIFWFCRPARLPLLSLRATAAARNFSAAPGGAPLVVQTTRPGAHLCSTRPAAGALSKVDSRRW
jgi:hypothetical protein